MKPRMLCPKVLHFLELTFSWKWTGSSEAIQSLWKKMEPVCEQSHWCFPMLLQRSTRETEKWWETRKLGFYSRKQRWGRRHSGWGVCVTRKVQGPECRSPAITQLLSGFTTFYNQSTKESEMQNFWGKLANLDRPLVSSEISIPSREPWRKIPDVNP